MMSGWLWLLIAVVVIIVVIGVVLWMRSGSATDTGADDPADPGTDGTADAGRPVPAPPQDEDRPVPAPPPDADRPGSLFETSPAEPAGAFIDGVPGDAEPDETPATAAEHEDPPVDASVVTDSADRNVTPDDRTEVGDAVPGVEAGAGDAAAESDPADPAEPGSPAEAEPERTVAGPGTTWTDVEPTAGSAPAGFAEATAAASAGSTAGSSLPVSGSALASLDAVLIVPASGEPVPGPHPGSVQAPADGSAPPDSHRIKAHSGSRRYHTLDSPYYIRTRADIYFVGAEEAEAAGFVAWNARPGGAPRRS